MNETTKVDPLATMDAKVWAEEFMRLFGDKRQEIDEGLMIAWFANAIMRGYDEGVRKHRNTFDQAREALKLALDYYRSKGTQKFNPYEIEQQLEKALAAMEATHEL